MKYVLSLCAAVLLTCCFGDVCAQPAASKPKSGPKLNPILSPLEFNQTERLAEFEHFVATHKLIGMPVAEVHALLGQPYRVEQHEHFNPLAIISDFSTDIDVHVEKLRAGLFSVTPKNEAVETALYLLPTLHEDIYVIHKKLGAPKRIDRHEIYQLIFAQCGNGCADAELEISGGKVIGYCINKGWEPKAWVRPTP